MNIQDPRTIALLLAGIAGGVALLIGLAATFYPASSSKNYGIPTSGEALSYVRATGIRDVFIGLTFLGAVYQGDLKFLGYLSLSTALEAALDFFVTNAHGAKKQSRVHLVATFAAVIYGLVLLSVSF